MIAAVIALCFVAGALCGFSVVMWRNWKYALRMQRWEAERYTYVYDVFQAAFAIQSTRRPSIDVKGDTASMSGTLLNYATLLEMVKQMQAVEEARRVVMRELTNSLNALRDWEVANPKPEPPTWLTRGRKPRVLRVDSTQEAVEVVLGKPGNVLP